VSRFAPSENVTVDLGECQCPGTPHEVDTAEIVGALGWDDLIDVGQAPTQGAAQLLLVTRALVSWNLEDETGPVPVDEASVHRLDKVTVNLIAAKVNDLWEAATAPLPNVSAAPSRHLRRVSGS
jgi:hypothetical protein